jgi:hypothetical protein
MTNSRSVMKIGVIIAAILIVVRIALEQAGAPESINNIFGVAWLYFVFPIFFAWSVAARCETGRYKALLKDVLLFAVYTRVMVMVTYALAYFLRWRAPRFSSAMGGTVGENVSLLSGVVIIPVRNALIWVLAATIIGMIIGSVILLIKRKKPAKAVATT